MLPRLAALAALMFAPLTSADSPVPIQTDTSYDESAQRLNMGVKWTWSQTPKVIGVAVFADLDHKNSMPDPTTEGCLDNALCSPREALAQWHGDDAYRNAGIWAEAGDWNSSVEVLQDENGRPGSADVSLAQPKDDFSGIWGDRTDSKSQPPADFFEMHAPKVLFPHGLNNVKDMCKGEVPVEYWQDGTLNEISKGCSGEFWLKFHNVTEMPKRICVVLYDIHYKTTGEAGSANDQNGYLELKNVKNAKHGVFSFRGQNADYNDDNSVKHGMKNGKSNIQVSCSDYGSGGDTHYNTDGSVDEYTGIRPPDNTTISILTVADTPASPDPSSPDQEGICPTELSAANTFPCEVSTCGVTSPKTFYSRGDVLTMCSCKGCFENRPEDRSVWRPIIHTFATDGTVVAEVTDGAFEISNAEISFTPYSLDYSVINGQGDSFASAWNCCGEACASSDSCITVTL